jgi:hypothetical protein
MPYYDDVWDEINGASTSAARDQDGRTIVRDSASFKGLPVAAQDAVNSRIEQELKGRMRNYVRKQGGKLDGLKEVKERAGRLIPTVLNSFHSNIPVSQAVRDSIYRSAPAWGGVGGIVNPKTNNGMWGQDPNRYTYAVPNVYISPYEAAAIYSQKGVPETIINKKSKSIFLNGVKIKNSRLSSDQLDAIRDDMLKNGLAGKIVESVCGSLTYAGALLFPMFRNDTPLTMGLNPYALAKYGVLGKGKISRWVSLDRWNTVHIPNWNPTAEDFQFPKKYYIPFLGADVAGSRCARIVTAPQPGYYGTLLTMGWGISDIPGWIESVYNYYSVMSAIPNMINQMSILVRQFEVEGPLATEGMNIMDDIDFEDTVRVREISANNPISMDIVGKLQAIQRDFKEVPDLVRLMRQDVGGRANIAEELIWSSERGAFSSGDTTEGALEKLWENNKYIHKDVEAQLKPVVQMAVINALGLGRDVLSALPYTTIEFDNPSLTDSFKKSEFFTNMMKGIFDGSASEMDLDEVVKIAAAIGDTDFPVDSAVMADLERRQKKRDTQSDEEHQLQMDLLRAQIEQTQEQIAHMGEADMGGTGSTGGGARTPAKSSGYSRLEQRKHETTRGTSSRREGLQKAKGKKV